MKKYLTLFRLSLQEDLEYRIEVVIWFLYDLVPPLVLLALWQAVYAEGGGLAGYSLSDLVTYYLGVVLLRALLTPHVEWAVSYDVRMGYLNRYLSRPIDPWAVWFVGELPPKLVRMIPLVPSMAILLFLVGGQVALPSLGPVQWVALAWSLGVAFALGFFLRLLLGLTAFWLIDIEGANWLYEVLLFLLSGTLLPLEVLVEPVATIARVLPFQYLYYFPMTIALGRVEGWDLALGLISQLAWLAAAIAAAKLLWPVALRQYEGVGI